MRHVTDTVCQVKGCVTYQKPELSDGLNRYGRDASYSLSIRHFIRRLQGRLSSTSAAIAQHISISIISHQISYSVSIRTLKFVQWLPSEIKMLNCSHTDATINSPTLQRDGRCSRPLQSLWHMQITTHPLHPRASTMLQLHTLESLLQRLCTRDGLHRQPGATSRNIA